MPVSQAEKEKFEAPPEKALPEESAEISAFSPDRPAKPKGGSRAEKARRKHEKKLFGIDGVEGVSTDLDEIGEEIIVVFVRDESVIDKIPETLEGVPVHAEVSGEFDAFLSEPSGIEPAEPELPAPPRKETPKRKTTAGKAATKAKTAAKRKAAPPAAKPKAKKTRKK